MFTAGACLPRIVHYVGQGVAYRNDIPTLCPYSVLAYNTQVAEHLMSEAPLVFTNSTRAQDSYIIRIT